MPNPLLHQSAVVGSIVSSTVGFWRGCLVVRPATQPALPLTLFEWEACPFCRLVREALTALHLDVDIRPCPRGGQRFRPEAERLGGKQLFPLLIDANTGVTMYESRDIVEYLFRTYGGIEVPLYYRRSVVLPMLGGVQTGVRLGRGARARRSNFRSHAEDPRSSTQPSEPLHLWSFEGSPYSRLVRERMTELELPYTLHNLGKEHWMEAGPANRRLTPNPYVPREGGKRHAFWQIHGRVQVPYLEDPNTGTQLFHSGKIIDYLERTYFRSSADEPRASTATP